ncbi:GCFC domain-containing protein [Psidium guajava]|nr:GCFC domain-containing protein [Psidium guajava]
MSSSRSKNFRRRAGDDEDDDEGPNGASAATAAKVPSKSAVAANKAPPKPKKPQAPKLLSFADDDGEDETQSRSRPKPSSRPSKPLSSSSSSHKISSLKDRQSPATPLPSNVLPQAGTYTKEALRELQKNTRTLASSSSSRYAVASESKPDPKSEPVIVLKGLVKPNTIIGQTLEQVDELSSDEEEGEKGKALVEKKEGLYRDDTERRLAAIGIAKGQDSSGSSFPDQAMINAIRAKRERLRQSRAAAPDYISLDGGSNHGAAEGLSDEEPEFQGRIAMFGEKIDGGKKGVFESFDDRAVEAPLRKETELEYDEDEEEKIWEEEQFRKGLGKRMDDGTARGVTSTSSISTVPVVHNAQQPQKYAYTTPAAGYGPAPSIGAAGPPPTTSIGGAMVAGQTSDVISIPQQAELAMKALCENARRLEESHSKTISSLAKTDENLSSSLLNVTALEKSLSAAGEKYIFMQKLRDYISVICKFLQDKAPYIEELEEQMQKLNEERATTKLERRLADNDDEMVEIEVAVNAAMLVFRKGDGSVATIAAATSAGQAAVAAMREQNNVPVKLDEFGRDMNLQKRMDRIRRAEARQRRKARFDSRRSSSMELDTPHQKIEGESSTDESDGESRAYKSNRDLLLQTADQIFDDTAEEYAQLSEVKEQFEKWKRDYSSSYRDAYMSLSVPNIFSPYVRLELLKWDPLHEDSDFFEMKWHSLLFDYGLPQDGSDCAPDDDDDSNLVPGLVEKVALPILHHEIAHSWDMLSTRETKHAVAATTLVTNYVPASSEALAELLVAVRTRLADAVAKLIVPTWSPLVMKAVPGAARLAAYRFGVSVRLLRNISLWKEILVLPVVEKLALDELLVGKILPHLRSIRSDIHDAATRTERIVASLSGVWAGPSVSGDRSHKLQPLVDYVLSLGKNLHKKHAFGVTEGETSGLARRIKKMLVELNEYDNAREIVRTFHLKEAL